MVLNVFIKSEKTRSKGKSLPMKNILIVSGHTNLDNSFANKIILGELEKQLPQAEFAYLDKLYPDFKIDVQAEQQRLIKTDVIVLQYPLFWYSIPSLLSRWIEEVFVHGFSHGSTGDKVKGKQLVLSFTSGAPEEMYKHGGLQNYPIEDFLPPLKQFANLCRMEWGGYIYSGDLSYASRHDQAKLEQMRVKAIDHAGRLLKQLMELQ